MTKQELKQLEELLGQYRLTHDLTTPQLRQLTSILKLVIRDKRKASDETSNCR